jgi:hypothetical protein
MKQCISDGDGTYGIIGKAIMRSKQFKICSMDIGKLISRTYNISYNRT